MPKIIEVAQNTKAWHDARLTHIGASEVATIMHFDPFGNKPFGLWMEKTGRKKRSSYEGETKKHGHKNEEAARLAYIERVGEFAVPVMVECTKEGWEFMSASLDGQHHGGETIVEIKCPLEAGTMREVKEGTIPDNYFAQVQAQLFVSEAKQCDFFCWFRGEGELVTVDPDLEFWEKEMLPLLKEFWARVRANKWPMPEGEIVIEAASDPAFNAWAIDMADIIQMERLVKDKRLRFEAQFYRQWAKNYQKVTGCGIEVAFTFKGGYTEARPRTVSDSLSCTFRRTE